MLLCDTKRCDDAVTLYRHGLRHCPDEPLLHFNLAVALEDLERIEEALASYERCMALSPGFADAHYNAARLHEMLGHATISQTMDTYSHVMPGMGDVAATALEEALS